MNSNNDTLPVEGGKKDYFFAAAHMMGHSEKSNVMHYDSAGKEVIKEHA